MAAAGGAVAAAAAAKTRLIREEEEEMTPYSSDDLHDWEFKIIRAYTGVFKKPENLQKVLEEESQAGWVLVEKFDDSRLRFKRKIANRSKDAGLTIDPYRTVYGGFSQQWFALLLILMIAFFFLLGIGFALSH
jgi:hypothetical protein